MGTSLEELQKTIDTIREKRDKIQTAMNKSSVKKTELNELINDCTKGSNFKGDLLTTLKQKQSEVQGILKNCSSTLKKQGYSSKGQSETVRNTHAYLKSKIVLLLIGIVIVSLILNYLIFRK
tara:strand:- start:343 stop:708 length:366 start_codon:yes stop_codon:yes gene_type:complete